MPPTTAQMRAFKIGARARKFAVEGCPIEGYDYLYGCLNDAAVSDPELHALLLHEVEKYDRRVQAIEDEDGATEGVMTEEFATDGIATDGIATEGSLQ